nr:MerR family DNA-binding transcriptional regulator [Anaeromicropila populeti]
MKTVTEVSKITGISVRTLHYYDEIGLLQNEDFYQNE